MKCKKDTCMNFESELPFTHLSFPISIKTVLSNSRNEFQIIGNTIDSESVST
jgi:hypothetical protein